jgi:acetyltransferase-like isoleucine patch superfamily enzyme
MKAEELLGIFGNAVLKGDASREITCCASLQAPLPGSLVFSATGDIPAGSTNYTVLCPMQMSFESAPHGVTVVYVADPKLRFVQAVRELGYGQVSVGIHSSVVCDYSCVEVGNNVVIHPGCVLGYPGFGFVRDAHGEYMNFPHIGKVLIGDDVYIGSNCVIDRGALTDTTIRKGTKIGNIVLIAHGVQIGERVIIVDQSIIAGSTRIGDDVWIGPKVCVRDNITIGNGALIGMGSVVTKDVTEGTVVFGVPAQVRGRRKDYDL